MIRIAICDDEVTTLHQTKSYLKAYPAEFKVDLFTSGEDLVASEENYEIILLDIDMSGMNGIETAGLIRKRDKKVKIIYITNYSDYTTFAFSVHAFAYILKPLKAEVLYKQLDEAFEYMKVTASKPLEFITNEGVLRLDQREILCFEYANRKVSMRTLTHTYELKRRISDLEAELRENGFCMPHKSFIVNLYAVKTIKGYDIHLVDESIVPLSQKKSMAFRKALNYYLSDGGR
ncbi:MULTISPECIES: LytTR family DNA-binding domain-containing protein [unclassified Fusibacter]|uniref:LytR/AlgR family response regulator transcription factor n=1 Tax=unclassified Fusibacter TaxID=2624464 RepID=UPI0010137E75|nr:MULTISPECIES: LytTR family DNA-binding domain-containing protein [unclassified Fusibacter]MCK8058152.1 LytTR family DNA-binding domain-containing protein [Fusibacter sp. A2]NPE20734.1 response regulator transcription factor [Fusibacter sp. A1]RXV62940.1 DNA-binding response regulator [Fusibacter sp. A1]